MAVHGLALLLVGGAALTRVPLRHGHAPIDVERFEEGRGNARTPVPARKRTAVTIRRNEAAPEKVPDQEVSLNIGAQKESDTSSAGEGAPEVPGVSDGSDIGIAPPSYPELSRLRGEQGAVLLELELDPSIKLRGVAVVGSSGHAMLDRAALQAVRRSLSPAAAEGPFARKRVRFVFRLQ